ncbi:MAG: AMP-binding protein [Bdellovibrionaceae bacterium]|nr:AMP-binding protein [Pseudobdellovibrionaceae bacterium]
MEKIWIQRYSKGVPAEIDISRYSSILDVFDESVRRFPDRKAFTNLGQSLTYRELDQKATSFAAFLQQELKLKKGDRIAIQMPNVLQFPIAMFGALKAGLICVNTNPLYTEREMKHQFNDSGAQAIVIVANFASNLQKILSETQIRHVIITELGDELSIPKRWIVNAVVKHVKKMVPSYSLPQAIPFTSALKKGASLALTPGPRAIDDVAFLQYTGGTTGISKGAMLTHRNILANMEQIVQWMRTLLKEGEEVAIAALPMYHIFCLTVHGLAICKFGGENVLITNPRDIPAFLKVLKTMPFTVLTGVNTLFNALMNDPNFNGADFKKLKITVAGGMALQKAVAERWTQLTRTPIAEGYGLTETSPVVCVNPLDGRAKVGTIGLPVPSTDVKLIDEDENEVQVGEPGELCVKGPQVMKGYWQRPDETEKMMTKDGWLKTGDVAVVDSEGFFKIVDRKKDMILVSGFNVYPNEIEDVMATHPGILEVAAIGVPDEKSGEVVKLVVVKKDRALTAEDLIDFARKNLTAYKVPRQVEFRTELPKTNVGKILRRALRDAPSATP